MCYTSKYDKKSNYTEGENVGIFNEGCIIFFMCLSYSEKDNENEWGFEKPEIFCRKASSVPPLYENIFIYMTRQG